MTPAASCPPPVAASQSASRELVFLAAVEARYLRATRSCGIQPGNTFGLGDLRVLAGDIPELLALARDGVLARRQLGLHAGHLARAEAVRELHDGELAPGGRLVCAECSRPFGAVTWPCLTLRVLDGDLYEREPDADSPALAAP